MLDISIIIPHKIGPSNDKALRLAIDSIMEYTERTYELILDMTVPRDPYRIWNEVSEQARGKTLVFSNSDVIFAPGWDVMADHARSNVIVTGYILEPGNIGVAPVNIRRDLGRHPDNFNHSEFLSFVKKHSTKVPELTEKRAWYMPCAIDKEWFLSTGGFPIDVGFPSANDKRFWDQCRDNLGTVFLRARSYSYHFQNQSARE